MRGTTNWLLLAFAATLALGCAEGGPPGSPRTGGAALTGDGAPPRAEPAQEALAGGEAVVALPELSPAARELTVTERGKVDLGLRGLLGLRTAAIAREAETDAALPPGLGAGAGQGRGMAARAADPEPNEDGEYCWEASYPDGASESGCWNPETGEFHVVYELAEPADGVVRVEQEGVAFYTANDAGYSNFTETSHLEDGSEFVTTYACQFEGALTECSAETENGDIGWLSVLVETEYTYQQVWWTDESTYAVAWGATYLLDGSSEVAYWYDDLATEFETDYYARMNTDASGAGWGMFEVPDEDGALVRYAYLERPGGGGFYMDADGNVAAFE